MFSVNCLICEEICSVTAIEERQTLYLPVVITHEGGKMPMLIPDFPEYDFSLATAS